MTRVQLPPTADLSIAQFAKLFEARGFLIEQLTDDRVQAQVPPSVVSDILPVERWFPAARVVVERSAAGFTISHRPPVRRTVVASSGMALLFFATIPGGLVTRFCLAAAAAGLITASQLRIRHGTLLAIGTGAPAAPAETPE